MDMVVDMAVGMAVVMVVERYEGGRVDVGRGLIY